LMLGLRQKSALPQRSSSVLKALLRAIERN